jgi:(2R)-3-sulfolactate dehydrogenase (NADP+)
VRTAPGWLSVDAAHGFAYPALEAALAELAPLAREQSVAGAAVRRSHHCGQLGAQVERLAEDGLVALMVSNTPRAMAAWGGREPLFGTNPIAFAAPRPGDAPLVVDLSLSKVARGKVMAAKKAGEPIPEGIALDADGRSTTDPDAALAGTMVPVGEAKGAALALMVEVLAVTLTGATPSREASSFFEADGPAPGVGHLILAFDPACTPEPGFGAGIDALVAAMTSETGVRLPGSRRIKARAQAEAKGVAVPAHLLAEIRALAGED